MPRVSYKALADYLKPPVSDDRATGALSADVYLIYGDSHLSRNSLQALLTVLMPTDRLQANLETVDAAGESIVDALERLNTYTLLAGAKVVVLANLPLSRSKTEKDRLMRQSTDAYRKGDIGKAAGYFMRLLALLNVTPADLARGIEGRLPPATGLQDADRNWLQALCEHCIRHELKIPKISAETDLLLSAIQKGFPNGNYLVLMTSHIDKRQQLFKLIDQKGLVVDCTVPQGDRHADKKVRQAAVFDIVNALCAENQKAMAPEALSALYEKAGFDLQTVVNSVEKLIAYVGQAPVIGEADVEAVLKRTRKDPIYTLTNAIANRNCEDAMFRLKELTAAGPDAIRPEQMLVAVLNQVRRLLLAKTFTDGPHGRSWQSGCSYPYFQQTVFPAVLAFDKELKEQLGQWSGKDGRLSDDQAPAASDHKSKTSSDLILAPNPKSPYPVYMLLKHSDNFSFRKLENAFESLYQADRLIKSGADNKRLALERAILKICR